MERRDVKYPKRIGELISVLFAVFMIVSIILCSCTKTPTYEIEESHEEKTEYGKWAYEGSSFAEAREKSEVVTARAEANGQIKEISDNVTLKGIDGDEDGANIKAVRDITNLTEITNKNGEEEFEIKDDYVFFQNLGSDISYEGKGSVELPISVDVKYYLDGKEMSADEIKGKKGHVKIEYRLGNNEQCELTIGGESRMVYVPFAAISIVTLEGDSYSNIKLQDCELSTFNNEDVIMALTLPGMAENMKYLDMESDSMDFPDSFSIDMDTENFELGFSTTVVTTDILDESIDLSDLSDMKDSLSELKNGMREISDASDDIGSGLKSFDGYLEKYTDGVDKLDKGMGEISKGIKEIDKNKGEIYNGAKNISEGIDGFYAAFSETKKSIDKMAEDDPANIELQTLKKKYEEMEKQLNALNEGGKSYTKGVETFNSGIGSLKTGAEKLKKGSGTLCSQGDSLNSGFDKIRSGYKAYNKAINKFYKEGIRKLDSEGRAKINDIENFVRMIEEADDGYNTYSGLSEGQKGKVAFIIETEEIKNNK